MKNFKSNFGWPAAELVNGNWDTLYKIDQNAPFHIRVQDNHRLVKKLKSDLKSDKEFEKLFNFHKGFIDDLKNTYIWSKQEDQIIKLSLKDIYETFIKYLKNGNFEDQLYNCSQISLLGPLGPFKDITLISLLNDEIVEKFILAQVIGNKLPMRNLRIHTEGKIRIEYGQDFDHVANLEIKQITDSGILFSSKDDLLLNTIEKSQFVKIFLDTRKMSEFVQNELKLTENTEDEFFYTKESLRYFFIEQTNIVKSLSYKSVVDNEIFLFCRYQHMLESDVPNIFYEFVSKVQNHLKDLAS